MDKVIGSPEEAVASIADGASVAIGGFGVQHRFPTSLIVALRDRGVRDLTVICNSLGAADQLRAQILAENGQIGHLVAAFSARPGGRSAAEEQIARGAMTVELVPQGILVERMRAGAAGLAGFYSPVGVGTAIAEGKEVREFDGRTFVFEHALRADVAFIRGHRADRMGNVQFRGGSRNFNPAFAKASALAIVEVDEVVEVGEIDPEDVDLPGIFVGAVVQATVSPPATVGKGAARRRPADSRREYLGRPALTRAEVAERASRLLPDGAFANLGTGMPTLVSNFIDGRDIMLHAENGILGYAGIVGPENADPDLYNAGSEFVSLRPGASFFDSVTSFEIARSGKLDAVILGAYQVDAVGNLANWSTPDMTGGGIGGAMDLTIDRNQVIVVMNHHDSKGNAKLVEECAFPLTAIRSVDHVVTDIALFSREGDRFVLRETAPGFSADDVRELTEMSFDVADEVGTMTVA